MKSSDRPKFGNLQNLKVLNAGAVIAAPFVCELFAEQGADVIELESTVAPDMYRMYGDAWSVDRRNQRMITLNIPSPEGKEILLQMVKWADVLVESSKGGTWEKWGLTDEVLWEANPALVILHISGFGNWGDPDYVRKASFDPIGQAFSGYSNLNGFPDSPPSVTKPFTGDFMTGLMGAWATLAAVIRARETGEGESIDCCQFEALVRLQGATLSDGINHGIQPMRIGNEDLVGACAGAQKCKDGYCQVAVGGVDGAAVQAQQAVFCHDGEVQHHLVHLRVAVAPDAQQCFLHAVQQGRHRLGVVALRQIVPGPVVQQVPQQQNSVRPGRLGGLEQLPAVVRGPVEV